MTYFNLKVVKCELHVEDKSTAPKLAAVKYLKDDASEKVKQNFRVEAETIGSFDHQNIVRLLGICVDDKGPACMVLGRSECHLVLYLLLKALASHLYVDHTLVHAIEALFLSQFGYNDSQRGMSEFYFRHLAPSFAYFNTKLVA